MNKAVGALESYVKRIRPHFEAQLTRMVNIPSVSVDPEHQDDIQRCAELAVEFLQEAGLTAEILPTSGNPVVFAQYVADPKYQTVTIYNHLDVMPADPSEWKKPPFKLIIDGDRYLGRGTTDDKGPALTALAAVRYAIANKLPLNFNFVWEFEEEMASPHFEEFVIAHKDRLKDTNTVVISDSIWVSADKPAISYGLRGITMFELRLRTGRQDAHSGNVGGAARNPVGELCYVINQCFDPLTGEVKIPGFYDDVQPASAEELQSFVESGFNVKQFMDDYHLESLRSYDTKDVLSRIMARPTFEVHGIAGGYNGPGIKTIVPPFAAAKISCRLVPNQNADTIFRLVKKFIHKTHPDIEVFRDQDFQPFLGEFNGPYANAARHALKQGFGVEPAFVRMGASISAAVTIQKHLGVSAALLGLSLPSHGYHAPNEYFDWGQASGGIKMYVHYFNSIADIKPKP